MAFDFPLFNFLNTTLVFFNFYLRFFLYQQKPCPDPLPRPAASEYEEFKDYEAVRNLEEMEEENEKVTESKG